MISLNVKYACHCGFAHSYCEHMYKDEPFYYVFCSFQIFFRYKKVKQKPPCRIAGFEVQKLTQWIKNNVYAVYQFTYRRYQEISIFYTRLKSNKSWPERARTIRFERFTNLFECQIGARFKHLFLKEIIQVWHYNCRFCFWNNICSN